MSKKKFYKNNNIHNHISSAERGIALAFASVVLITLIVMVLNPRIMNDGTLAIVRFLAASFAGISGYFFSGNLGIEAKVPLNKFQIRATGAFATFIITLFFFFVGIPSSSQQYLETEGSSLEKFSDPEQFKNKIFSCKTVDGIPTTFMKISGGQNEHPFILWVSVPEFYDSTYTPEKRCQEVSKRFQKTYEEGHLESIYSGEFAGYPAICASETPKVTEEIKFKPCTEENILIILRPSDNPKQIIKRFVTLLQGRGGKSLRL